MKKLVALLLTFTLLFTIFVPVYAIGDDDLAILDELENNIDYALDDIKSISTVIEDSGVSFTSLSNVFNGVVKTAGVAGTLLGAVNGTVTFLKLIGVIEDPTAENIKDIRIQLQCIDEKIKEMDTKLTDIRNRMAQLTASVEFNARAQKADTLFDRWDKFMTTYLEDGLDKLIDDYDAMLSNAMRAWCRNISDDARIIDGTDNTSIYILYKKNAKGGYDLTFSNENGVPKSFTKDDRYIAIQSSRMPQSVTWNANTYPADIKSELKNALSAALSSYNQSGVVVSNYPSLTNDLKTPNRNKILNQLAEDAVNTLIYRSICAQVNKDSDFTKEVIRVYTNYTTHLTGAEEGLDALLKTYSLTHCFEGEVKETVEQVCAMMNLKNLTYGVFVGNVLELSEYPTTAEEKKVITAFNKSIEGILNEKSTFLTGRDRYCYITGTLLGLGSVTFNNDMYAFVHHDPNGTMKYCQNYYATSVNTVIDGFENDKSSIMGEGALLLLSLTAESCGKKVDFSYLEQNTNSSGVFNYGRIVTDYSSSLPFELDGQTPMNVNVSFGEYFTNGLVSTMPSKAGAEYLRCATKITGGLYDLDTGAFSVDTVLFADGLYVEDRYFIDEVAFLSGPADLSAKNYRYNYYSRVIPSNNEEFFYAAQTMYNIVTSTPVSSLSGGIGDPTEPETTPGTDGNNTEKLSLWEMIKKYFDTIIGFFRKIFAAC